VTDVDQDRLEKKNRPSVIQRLPLPLALFLGALLLPIGAILLPLFPEFGIVTLLVATRLLGRKFAWAMRFNGWIDRRWHAIRARLKGDPNSSRPALWRWIVGTLVIVLLWQVVGSIVTIFVVVNSGLEFEAFLPQGGFGAVPISPDRAALILLAILLSFVPFFVANLIAYRYILKERLARLFTQTGTFSVRRMLFGFSLWIVIGLIGIAAVALLNPGVVEWTFNPAGALPYVLVALLLIPVQTTAEELFFRGWLLQWSDSGRRRRSTLAAINGVLFALPHLANPEVAGEDLVRIVGYIAIGYVWAWVTLRDRTLELAIGAHAANNISAALLVGYVGSAIPSLSLWTMDRIPVLQEVVLGLASAVVFAWITERFGVTRSEKLGDPTQA
jgi:membrane protease YdiL (CAAX protease family)